MQYRKLGRTDVKVSVICLGTMTWGQQNTEQDAHQQLDYALSRGVNFIDTAEMYPVPPEPQKAGLTEKYIGSWLKARGGRDKIVLATKVAGRSGMPLRPNGTRLDAASIRAALEKSLERLQTDYLDLYQVHWPERNVNVFERARFDPTAENKDDVPLEETLEALHQLVKEGKVRHIGVSNETPWGVMRYLDLAKTKGWSRIASIQNIHNLLHRGFETGLAEISFREDVSLLAYSPLAFGVLSGKYAKGARPQGARLTMFKERFGRFILPQPLQAADKFAALAQSMNLDPSVMAVAWVTHRPYTTSCIIGATTLEQLKVVIDAGDVHLTADQNYAIDVASQEYSDPATIPVRSHQTGAGPANSRR